MQKRGIFKFSNKKATLTLRQMLIHLGMLGIAMLVFFLLQSYVKSIEADTEFYKLFLSRDLALLDDTLYAAPGKVDYTYSFNKLKLNNFKFEFKSLSTANDKQVVRVEEGGLAKTYPYARPVQISDSYIIYGIDSIRFSKTDEKVIIS